MTKRRIRARGENMRNKKVEISERAGLWKIGDRLAIMTAEQADRWNTRRLIARDRRTIRIVMPSRTITLALALSDRMFPTLRALLLTHTASYFWLASSTKKDNNGTRL